MDSADEKQALQNFANKFGMTVHKFYPEDCRKKYKWFLVLNGCSISPLLSYSELNCFLLGWDKCVSQINFKRI